MNEVEARIESLLKEIGDVKVVMTSDSDDYWPQYLKMLENEMIELSLLGDVVTSRAEMYRGFKNES